MNIRSLLVMVIALTMLAGCSSVTHIIIDYQLPPQTVGAAPASKPDVLVEFEDQRSDRDIFGPGAAKEFRHFSGLFSLYLAQDPDSAEQEKQFVGTYDLPVLFVTAFQKRLQSAGIRIAPAAGPQTARFRILLKKFNLDLVERSWTADVSYDVQMMKTDKKVVTKKVSGSANRIKIVGKGDAEKVLAEIFSDTVNRLGLDELLELADL